MRNQNYYIFPKKAGIVEQGDCDGNIMTNDLLQHLEKN